MRFAMTNLLVIPTSIERRVVEPYIHKLNPRLLNDLCWQIELCGFGLVAAAARTSQAISLHRPQRVLLIGIAGSLQDTVLPGTACAFDRVTCHGIGVGASLSKSHLSADQMGWAHCEANENYPAVGDTIRIAPLGRGMSNSGLDAPIGQLLSVTTASADEFEASVRRQRYPNAMTEDMEGFAVAIACSIANVPVQIVRGISNRAGDRDHAHWKFEDALYAAVDLAIEPMSQKL
jgi:futalosine hydrolase